MSKKIKFIIESNSVKPQTKELNENIFKNLLDLVNIFGNKGVRAKIDSEALNDIAFYGSTEISGGKPVFFNEIAKAIFPISEDTPEEKEKELSGLQYEFERELLNAFNKEEYNDPNQLFAPGLRIAQYYVTKVNPNVDPNFKDSVTRGFPEEGELEKIMKLIPQGLLPNEKSTDKYIDDFKDHVIESILDMDEGDLSEDLSELAAEIARKTKIRLTGTHSDNVENVRGVFPEDALASAKIREPEDKKDDASEPEGREGEEPTKDAADAQDDAEGREPEYGDRKQKTAHWGNAPGFSKQGPELGSDEDGSGRPSPPPLPDEDGAIPVDPEDVVSVEDNGIPIYKFGSRDAAGPDGKRTQPLISKLMKTGLPKSVINTVIKSITKDLKASNVPFYESKEQLTNVLQEHIREVLLGRVDESSFKRSLQKKLEKRQELADKIFKDLKPGETVTIDRSDEEELKALKDKYSGLALALTKNSLVDGNYTKTGDGVKFKGLQDFQKGGTKSSLEKKYDVTSGTQRGQTDVQVIDKSLDKILGDTFSGPELTVIRDLATSNQTDNPIEMIDKEQAKKAIEDIQTSSEEEVRNRTSDNYRASTSDAPSNWLDLGMSISEKPQVMGKSGMKKNIYKNINWNTAWSGTATFQYRDGLSRKEKELWLALTKNIETAVKGAPYPGIETLEDRAKEAKFNLGLQKNFMKMAIRRQVVLTKALAAKQRLKSGKRGGGQIQLSVLNQQLDTISGPGLEGRDSKVVGGKRTPGKQAMARNKETGKMEPMFTTGPNGERVKVMAGASRRQKSLALRTVQQHLKPYLKQYGLSISEAQETALEGIIVEMYHRFGDTDPQIFGRILKEALSNQGLIK